MGTGRGIAFSCSPLLLMLVMTWFRRAKQAAPPPPIPAERLEAVEDGLARLERRFLKLQGELTGSIRYQRELERQIQDREEYDDEPEPDYDGE